MARDIRRRFLEEHQQATAHLARQFAFQKLVRSNTGLVQRHPRKTRQPTLRNSPVPSSATESASATLCTGCAAEKSYDRPVAGPRTIMRESSRYRSATELSSAAAGVGSSPRAATFFSITGACANRAALAAAARLCPQHPIFNAPLSRFRSRLNQHRRLPDLL